MKGEFNFMNERRGVNMKKILSLFFLVSLCSVSTFAVDTYLFDDEFNGPGGNHSDPNPTCSYYQIQADTTKWQYDCNFGSPAYSSWGVAVDETTSNGYRTFIAAPGTPECYTQITAATFNTVTVETFFTIADTTLFNIDAHFWVCWRMTNPGANEGIRLIFNVEQSTIYIQNKGGSILYAGPTPHTFNLGDTLWVWIASKDSTHRVVIRNSNSPTAFQYWDVTFTTDPGDPVSGPGRLAHGAYHLGRIDVDYFRAGDIALPVQPTAIREDFWMLIE
jgi:hypothetical protein